MAGASTRSNGGGSDERKQKAEAASLKRGREASLEPTAPESQQMAASTSLKKNRLDQETSPIPEDTIPASTKTRETKTVSEVRKKVEKMSHVEGEETDGEIEVDQDQDQEQEQEKVKDLKRKALERSESSAAVGEDENEAKRVKDTPSPPVDTPIPTKSTPNPSSDPAPPPTKKPQATFGAFSSSTSPFAKPSSTPSASGSGASAFGSSGTAPAKPFSSSGFGGFSGSSSPFAAKKTSVFASTAATTPAGEKRDEKADKEDNGSKEKDEGKKVNGGEKEGFGDILSGVGDDEEIKDKPQMTEMDVVTGEEDENTKFQMRTKLYVMQSDNSWRERGVGVLRLNVNKGDGHGARLVMRAEGVLRLILNVSLYVGQTCLEDGKYVRTTVFEDGERRFVTFRTGSAKAAQELSGHIQEHIPLESSVKSSEEKKSEWEEPNGGW